MFCFRHFPATPIDPKFASVIILDELREKSLGIIIRNSNLIFRAQKLATLKVQNHNIILEFPLYNTEKVASTTAIEHEHRLSIWLVVSLLGFLLSHPKLPLL